MTNTWITSAYNFSTIGLLFIGNSVVVIKPIICRNSILTLYSEGHLISLLVCFLLWPIRWLCTEFSAIRELAEWKHIFTTSQRVVFREIPLGSGPDSSDNLCFAPRLSWSPCMRFYAIRAAVRCTTSSWWRACRTGGRRSTTTGAPGRWECWRSPSSCRSSPLSDSTWPPGPATRRNGSP